MRNKVDSIHYLIKLLNGNNEKEWMRMLRNVLSSPDLEEIHNNPEVSRAGFFECVKNQVRYSGEK